LTISKITHSGSLRVIIAAIAGNVAIAICKFSAALVTGSAAMYSEAIHSAVDTGNELLLLFGMRRADKPPDAEHPFGYGLQLYFWVFVVAVMIFGLGALVAFYEGVDLSPCRPKTVRPGEWAARRLRPAKASAAVRMVERYLPVAKSVTPRASLIDCSARSGYTNR
jgi:divalent metal cation (Fe/Co/Zn/Cd) transporter